ncbi:conserved hypothetical protein [Uncinocarpus reesii 1704]|uniref:Uncharacterized protein n=1 Tax=Uncinocarpus reesii (strain UAMH 1704) TaxID=336963 RepID=C4JVE1_UNCRE|nr:uncharacterized protein UREG_06533 [Uncinocarpus reesii 1704]EEP81668.1 conserved hypothetical protein [Uncinocarpus reesii 1704]
MASVQYARTYTIVNVKEEDRPRIIATPPTLVVHYACTGQMRAARLGSPRGQPPMIASELGRKPENGHGGSLPASKEIFEYEKILNIRDQIFSGSHPRLKVPQHVIRNFTPRSLQSPSIPTTPSGPPDSATTAQQKESQMSSSTQKSPSGSEPAMAMAVTTVTGTSAPSTGSLVAASTATTSTKPASEIDPIFLTKSDDLIRAEIQLQRQRIERALRDQVEQRRTEARTKPLPQELNPDFDIAEVFGKALELSKPISEIDTEGANGNIAASDSFDENSFYSSKAPDSPQNEPVVASPIAGRQPQPMVIDDAVADTYVARDNGGPRYMEKGIRSMVNLQSQPASFEAGDKDMPTRSTDNTPVQTVISSSQKNREEPETFEEPEYSPPGPNVVETRRDRPHIPAPERANVGQPFRRPSRSEQEHQYPMQDVRVVRNHITSPAAPQPSRVSPLAVSKAPGFPRQNRRQRKIEKKLAAQASARTSPEPPVQPLVPRKRRRDQEFKDNARFADERRHELSPEMPHIKPEPMSPPPFIEVPSPAYVRTRIPQGGSTYIELDSPHYTPVSDRREGGGRGGHFDERPTRTYELDSATEVNVPRSSSRLAARRALREDRDLRRVATMQHARQSEYVHDYPEPIPDAPPRYVRAASYAIADRPVEVEKPRYYDEIAPYPKPYAANVRPASPRIRQEYIETNPEPRSMAPPPQRRIVIDADGNRYYESLAPSSRMAPPSTRLAHAEPYDERSPIRAAPVRAVSVIENPYPERRYVQDMPPPPVTYRRVPEYARVAPSDHGIYEREIDDRPRIPRGASVQVIDYPHQHQAYVEETAYPREELVRMSSVRPPPSRYEAPGEPPMRMQSVRPVRREVSVYIDDEPHQSREYAPMNQVNYPASRQVRAERYYDDEDAAKMELEGSQGVVRRVSRRY